MLTYYLSQAVEKKRKIKQCMHTVGMHVSVNLTITLVLINYPFVAIQPLDLTVTVGRRQFITSIEICYCRPMSDLG